MKEARPGGSTLQSAYGDPSSESAAAGPAAATPGKQTLTAHYGATAAADPGIQAKQSRVYAAAMALAHQMTATGTLESAGHAAGVGLGVLVTEALRVIPDWNRPVLDAAGKPIASAPGVARIGNHDILKRHEEVVGPQIAKLVAKLSPGALHDIVQGLGAGATEAPGDAYRLEVRASDLLHGK